VIVHPPDGQQVIGAMISTADVHVSSICGIVHTHIDGAVQRPSAASTQQPILLPVSDCLGMTRTRWLLETDWAHASGCIAGRHINSVKVNGSHVSLLMISIDASSIRCIYRLSQSFLQLVFSSR